MKFGKKLSVEAFKAQYGSPLQVVKNPKTEKLFVTAAGVTVGAVSKNYDAAQPKEFVELITEDTGETIWCLHNPSDTNVVETL